MMLARTPGGADRFFEKLTLAFAEAGVPQLVVIEPNPEREAMFGKYENLRVEALRFGGFCEPFARLRLGRLLRDFRPDVAMTWMSRASRRMPAGDFLKVARLGDYYPLKHYTKCDYLVANTPDILRYMKEGGWSEERVKLVGNFCDPPDLAASRETVRREVRVETGVPDEATVLLALGRLHPKKAHDVVFRAMADLPDHYLLLGGEGPLRGELEQLAGDLGLSGCVRFLGWRRDAERLFAAADLCVVASRFEPLGNVVLEAWANRVPLVAARSTGPEWLVEEGRTGLLFPIDDHAALRDCLRRVEGDTELRRQLVESGHARFVKDFSRDAIVAEYLAFFGSAREHRRANG